MGLAIFIACAKLATAEEPVAEHASPSFFHDVIPALSKQGCSSGACHGSPNGKNGFRLSLRGYDPLADVNAIVKEEFGRRVDQLSPENSLLLRKPMMQVAHSGGKQLHSTDDAYPILRNWIANGCPIVEPKVACTGIRFGPTDELLLSPSKPEQQVTVWAMFADGSQKDVSKLAVYSSSDVGVTKVSQDGLVTGVGRGQAGVSARYLEHWNTLIVTFAPSESAKQATEPQSFNEIDDLVVAQLDKLQLSYSKLCTDEQFVRRVYLDVIGILPTISEVKSFIQDSDVHKRAKLIDALLERPEYARFWALKWGDLLRINKQLVSAAGVHKYNRWLIKAFEENMPYDQFVKELLLAQGSTFENPPANYYRTANTLNDATETTAQVFMGVRLECCKCHNHPFEKWSQDNYYGFAAFFSRLKSKPSRRVDEMVIWLADEGEVIQPRTQQEMRPWLPGNASTENATLEEGLSGDRRVALVNWLTRPDNEFLAAVEVNRIWSHVMGRGMVDPVDDFRDSNPPSNPKLLSALASDFRNYGFDRKRTLRKILNSRTYQTSSDATANNKDDDKYFSHYRSRLMTAEQLLDAIGTFTELPELLSGLPVGTRATQLPSPDVNVEFLEVFGQPKRDTVCQCERTTEVTLPQALQIANGKLVQEKLTSSNGRLHRLLQSSLTRDEIVEELFLAAYARLPNEIEIQSVESYFTKRNDRESALQDLAWALINSNEFLMQR